MLIPSRQNGFQHPHSSEITPRGVYEGRRDMLRWMATGAAGAALASWASREAMAAQVARPGKLAALPGGKSAVAGAMAMDKVTDYKDATTYNNYYEFGVDKSDPARNAHTLKTSPWTVEVEGLVNKPRKFAIEDLLKLSPQEERIYRLRCVEGWSMVIPWVGYSLSELIKRVEPQGSAKYVQFAIEDLLKLSPQEERIYRLRCVEGWSMVIPWVGYSLSELIKRVEPQGSAKYVQFVTLADKATMPFVGSSVLDWPYTEGLRLDEAMHPLTLLAFGMYGEVLPNQNGAPVRLVVPWKYGFKSAKSIVKIRFVEKEPSTAWNKAAAQEYGFYSNVNPNVDHPRWSQASERRIGEDGLFAKKRKTLMFNGYEEQVGQMYAGMDLKKNY